MTDFLLELLSEEIPARMQAKARADLERLFVAEIAEAGLRAEAIETYATPRRLVLIARGLPAETEAVSEEIKGPRAGAPPQALEGFLRKTGLKQDQLVERDGIWFATLEQAGRATASVLAEAVPAIVRAFPWPKSMRWGAAATDSLRWVRPLQGILALLGEEIVAFEIDGIRSGAATLGHRFHHPGIITIGGANDYAEKLRACHVILDPAERSRIILEGARSVAEAAGLALIEDEGLLGENAGLTEWPVPLLGGFDPAFLELPREVIQLTMRTNQKYFALADAAGALAPNFVCVANIEASDGGASIVEGNRRVLAARLADAKFFWEQDLKVPLEDQAARLDQIIFHEKLGTVADKVERVVKLARWLVDADIVKPLEDTPQAKVELSHNVFDAAMQCKADLVSGLVGEFPELQGIIGGHLALAQGLRPAVADAIRDHYKPVGQADDVPTAPATVAVSLADKLDTLATFFVINELPTGSKDPFALRRSMLGFVSLVIANSLRLSWVRVFQAAAGFTYHTTLRAMLSPLLGPEIADVMSGYVYPNRPDQDDYGITQEVITTSAEMARAVQHGIDEAPRALNAFVIDRLKVQQREAGVRHDLIDAVFALGGEDDLVRLLVRVKALQAFVETSEGADLLAGYRRAANILRAEEKADGHPARPVTKEIVYHETEPAEDRLLEVLDVAGLRAQAAIEREAFENAMTELAKLRAPIDDFFDQVMVNDPDNDKRAARLGMLARFRDAVHQVADFSKIEG